MQHEHDNNEKIFHSSIYKSHVLHEDHPFSKHEQDRSETSVFKVRYEPLKKNREDSISPIVRMQRRPREQRLSSFEKLYDGVDLESYCQKDTIHEHLNSSYTVSSDSIPCKHDTTKNSKLDAKSLIQQEQEKYEVYKAEFKRQHSEDCDDSRGITGSLPNEYDYKMSRITQPTHTPKASSSEQHQPDNEYDYFLKRHIRAERNIVQVTEPMQLLSNKLSSSHVEQRTDIQRQTGHEQFDVEQFRRVGYERLQAPYTEDDTPPIQFHRRPSDRFKEYHVKRQTAAPATPTMTCLSSQIMDHIKQHRGINNKIISENIMESAVPNNSAPRDLCQNIEFIDIDDVNATDAAAVTGITEMLSHQHQSHQEPHMYRSNSYVNLKKRERRLSLDDSITDANRIVIMRSLQKQPRPSSLTFGEDNLYNTQSHAPKNKCEKAELDSKSVLQQCLVSDEPLKTVLNNEQETCQSLNEKQMKRIPANNIMKFHTQDWREGDTIASHAVAIYAKPMSRSNRGGVHNRCRIVPGDERQSPFRNFSRRLSTEDNYFLQKNVGIQ